jgi:hypothetical protein
MTRKVPQVWSHQEISVLTKLHGLHGDTPEGLHKTEKSFERHTPTDVRAKLIELEMLPKPVKPTLTAVEKTQIEEVLDQSIDKRWDEPRRTLAIRFAISSLSGMLPKRAPKAPAA